MCHCWLVQQWAPGTRFALPGQPTVAPDWNQDAEMDLDRIAIVGMSCAGKSTLARQLGERLAAPHIHLDELHWGPNWTARSAEEFLASVERAVAAERWISDGNYRAVRHIVLQRATTVIWLNLPLATLLPRAFHRTFKRLATRERLFNGNREPLFGFLKSYWIPWWILGNYHAVQRELGAQLQQPEFAHLTVVEIRSARELSAFLGRVKSPPTEIRF